MSSPQTPRPVRHQRSRRRRSAPGLLLGCALGLAPLSLARAQAPDQVGPYESPPLMPIVGGVPTIEGELDAIVALRNSQGFLCTGTQVTPTLILTAAHCLVDSSPGSTVTVYFGNSTETDEVMVSSDFGAHPNFCKPCREDVNDFAYVVLPEERIPSDGVILPIVDQAEWDEAMREGNVALLAGFGTDDPFADTIAPGDEIKRKVTVTIGRITGLGLEFFAGGGGRDSCNGDSGGPAVFQLAAGPLRLAGITSRGSKPCGNGGFYGVPYAALLWVRSETGVDLLPESCSLADCLDTVPEPTQGEGCSSCATSPDRPASAWLLLALGAVRPRRRLGPRRPAT